MLRAAPLVVGCLWLLSACASVPQYRPVVDLPGKSVEIGIVPQVAANLEGIAPLGGAWATFRTEAGFDFFAFGHGGAGFTFDDGSYGGHQVGVSAGVRYRVVQDFIPDMRFAFEAYGDYLQEDYTFVGERPLLLRRHVSAIVRAPIAQRVAGSNFWVYVAPTLGVSLPLYDDPPHPFFGIQEMPAGVAASVTDWLWIVVEGGYYVPLNGGYGSVGAMLSF